MKASIPLVVYVDVDDTLVRSAGTKRMLIPKVVMDVKQLVAQGEMQGRPGLISIGQVVGSPTSLALYYRASARAYRERVENQHHRRSSVILDSTNQPLWIDIQPSREHEEVSDGDCFASVLRIPYLFFAPFQ